MSDKGKGRFVWFDLMTTDPDAAIKFYSAVVGWGTSPFQAPGSDTPYTMWTASGKPIGGVMELPAEAAAMGAPPHWLPYIGSPDVDATVARAKQIGANVLVPGTDIPTVGRFAVLADPQGATFSVFTALEDAPGHDGKPSPGEFSWHELNTTDHLGAFDFYHDLFGWEKTEAMDMGPMGVYQMFGLNGNTMGGMFNKPPEMPAPPMWLEYAMVDDVNARIDTIRSAGGQILNGPMEVPGGDVIAQCLDPQGAMFAIHSLAK